jgi:hypothetical protein
MTQNKVLAQLVFFNRAPFCDSIIASQRPLPGDSGIIYLVRLEKSPSEKINFPHGRDVLLYILFSNYNLKAQALV